MSFSTFSKDVTELCFEALKEEFMFRHCEFHRPTILLYIFSLFFPDENMMIKKLMHGDKILMKCINTHEEIWDQILYRD